MSPPIFFTLWVIEVSPNPFLKFGQPIPSSNINSSILLSLALNIIVTFFALPCLNEFVSASWQILNITLENLGSMLIFSISWEKSIFIRKVQNHLSGF